MLIDGKRFTKIKDTGTHIEIKWETPISGERDPNRARIKSQVEPHPDFRSALRDLVSSWETVLELPSRYATGVRIRSLQVSYNSGEISGAIITAQKKVSSTSNPVVISTPSGAALPAGTEEVIRKVCREAAAYLGGKSGEEDLFTGESESEELEAHPKALEPAEA